MQEMPFPFSAMVQTLLVAGGVIFAVLLGLLLLLRGRIFNYAVSALFALTLAGYLQGNFLNGSTGALDGNAVNWLNSQASMLLGLLLWLCVFLSVFFLLYVSRRIWTHVIWLVCTILIGAQLTAFAVLVMQTGFDTVWKAGLGDRYVSREGLYEIAPKQNVIVFLLDRMDNQYMDDELRIHPDWQERLSGFTYYHNFTGSYSNTRPAITYFFTGVQHDYSVPWEDYFQRAWARPVYPFLEDIHNAGYRTGIYMEGPYVFGEEEDVEGFIDNIRAADRDVDYKLLFKRVLELSIYRYAPEALHPFFQIYKSEAKRS